MHLDLTLGVEPDGHQVLKPVHRRSGIRIGGIRLGHHRQAEHYPVVQPGLVEQRLSDDALALEFLGNELLTLSSPGLKAEEITQAVATHPARDSRAHFDRSPDTSHHIIRMLPLNHDRLLSLLTECTRTTTYRYQNK